MPLLFYKFIKIAIMEQFCVLFEFMKIKILRGNCFYAIIDDKTSSNIGFNKTTALFSDITCRIEKTKFILLNTSMRYQK